MVAKSKFEKESNKELMKLDLANLGPQEDIAITYKYSKSLETLLSTYWVYEVPLIY